MRVAIGAIALFCGTALLDEPGGPATRAQAQVQLQAQVRVQAQATDPCGWIGVAVSPITSAFAASLGMVEPYGAIFEQPEPGSPAADAGIQAGDVITSIDGANIEKASDFATMISGMAPQSIIHLLTYRDGQPMERKVMLGLGRCPRAKQGGLPVLARQS
jgi:C-terminal processing protease CtpA/Prc